VGADITGSGEFGRSIDLVVNGGIPRVAIGAPETSLGALSNIGAAHVLEYSGGSWSLMGSILYGEAANDSFGISVSLSSDGTRLSVGSGENDAGGSNAGHVRTFDWDGSAWNQVGLDIDGDVVDEFSGNVVSLSGDGTQLAIGAYGSNADSGKVKVLNYNIPIVDKQTFSSTIFEIGTANIYVDTSLTRVGIGTSTPQATLDVNGPMRIDSIDLNKSVNQNWVKLKEVGPPDIVFPTMGGVLSYLNIVTRGYSVVTIDGNRAAIPLTIIPASTQTTYPAVINVYEYDKNVWNVKYSIPEPANARNGSASGNETYWGQNIALSGDYLYVTAQYEGGGVIYVYKRNPSNGAWLFHTKLMAPSGVSSFGALMDVSGDYVIAGVATPRAGSNSISIFTRNPVDELVWSQQVIFTDSHDNTGNLHAVAISGDYAIASYPFGGLHPGDSSGARKNDGRVKVFARNPATGTWSLQQTLSGNNHYEEFFGYAAAISGDYIVASSDNGHGAYSSGNGNRLYIYKRDPNLGSWSLSQQQPVSIASWYLGKHLSMSDDHIILGMKTDTGTGGTNSGVVNVYTRDGTSWSLTKRFLGELLGYYFGQFVNISGTKFLVHQLGSNSTGNTNGSIHFYNLEHSLEVSSPISVFGTTLSFTGQHLCSPEGPMSQGLVVSANKNRYTTLNGPLATGSRAIRSSEALPVVSLSESQNDRSVFGVVDRFESGDGTTRNQTQGATIVMSTKEIGDQKVIVNSLGEGAVWVVNTNGAVVSGDYLTTSNVSGYTQKQDDDILHNYTVAKITMDCDFNPVDLPVQVIKKKENGENDLDQYGRIQWEDTERTEKSYHLRYLTTDGTVTDEANAVWTAAYVGCTYHCG
jgi:hypothetical protein